MRVACEFCQLEIDTKATGTYQFTSGWSRRRSQGGSNQISLPERTQRFACYPCVDTRARRLLRPEFGVQLPLFEAD